MERLYTVPSEQLRVWAVWLSNVGDIADDWQKWLRMYIETITQIAEQLPVPEAEMESRVLEEEFLENEFLEDEFLEDAILEEVLEEEKEIEFVSNNAIPLHRILERKLSESNRKNVVLR